MVCIGRQRLRTPPRCRARQPWRPGRAKEPVRAAVWGFGLRRQIPQSDTVSALIFVSLCLVHMSALDVQVLVLEFYPRLKYYVCTCAKRNTSSCSSNS